jgi:hypothetical protein
MMMAGVMCCAQAHASLIISAGSATVAAGGSGFVDITLQNTSSTAFATPIDGFSVELNLTGDGALTFTGATMSTAATYIFAGGSLDVDLSLNFYSNSPSPNISDIADTGNGTTIAGNTTLGLGRFTFMVAGGAATGTAPVTLTTDGSTSISDVNGAAITASLSNGQINITGTSTPEPSTLVPLALLLSAVGIRVRRGLRPTRVA